MTTQARHLENELQTQKTTTEVLSEHGLDTLVATVLMQLISVFAARFLNTAHVLSCVNLLVFRLFVCLLKLLRVRLCRPP